MQSLTVAVPAKINLSLDVVGRRADGYHLLQSIMQSVSLYDEVYVELDRQGQGIILLCDRPGIPLDDRNTCYRAAGQFLAQAGLMAGVRIFLHKRIPEAAGLAGGSSDAAGVLYALSELCDHPLSLARLQGVAARIGADVPFCLQGGTVLCEGIGEALTPLPPFTGVPLLLVKPDFGLSTPWVFRQLNLASLGLRPDHPAIQAALAAFDLEGLAVSTANVLESVSIPAHPELSLIKQALHEAGATVAMMSGSGPTVFGLFANSQLRDAAQAVLPARLPPRCQLLAAETVSLGPHLTGNI